MAKNKAKSTKEKAADLEVQRLVGDVETPAIPQDQAPVEQPQVADAEDAATSEVAATAAEVTNEADEKTRANGEEAKAEPELQFGSPAEKQEEPELPELPQIDFSKEPDPMYGEQKEADQSADEQPSDHPALSPNGSALYLGDPASAQEPDGLDFHFPKRQKQQAALPEVEVTRAEEPEAEDEGADDNPFNDPDVLARINELNKPEILQRGESVVVTLGSQKLDGEIAGHNVSNGVVSYHVSVRVADADFIQGKPAKTLELPIPAEFVSK